jgi:hypothetical protein
MEEYQEYSNSVRLGQFLQIRKNLKTIDERKRL